MHFLKHFLIIIFVAFTSYLFAQDNKAFFSQGLKAYQMLNIPKLSMPQKGKPIIVAVIDDGFNFNHKDLKPYIFQNSKEIKGNNIDDDNNGFVDDYFGWDFGDNDNNVSISEKNAATFQHGTMIAGIILKTVEEAYGKQAVGRIEILPVKVLADAATVPNYENGYTAIDYAINLNADIICLAWSGGKYDSRYDSYFNKARDKGILIIGAAGNAYSEPINAPATQLAVTAVAAVDTLFQKLPSSSYGVKVALSACGQNVLAPFANSDSLYTYCGKTSAATALVSGCAAILKIYRPTLSASQITEALEGTAVIIDAQNLHYGGKMGAGIPDVTKAIEYVNTENKAVFFNSKYSKGFIVVDKNTGLNEWKIKPDAPVKEYRFSLSGDVEKQQNNTIVFYNAAGKVIDSIALKHFPLEKKIESPDVKIIINGGLPKKSIRLNYYSVPIDSTKLYCSDTIMLNTDYGKIEDGSGSEPYVFNSNCKWLIKVSEGKNIRLDFEDFDTQEEKDNLLIFKGNEALQENMMARFSGDKLPPSIVIYGNEVLLWFITDEKINGKGWRLKYSAVTENPGIISR